MIASRPIGYTKIKVLGVLAAYLPLGLDADTALVAVPVLKCAGFVYCHGTDRLAMLDYTHGKDIVAFL